jgi:hypothetical protein
MTKTWKDHCPIEEGESPAEREAWRKGWAHRNGHDEKALDVTGEPLLLSVWLEGYSAADRHEQND